MRKRTRMQFSNVFTPFVNDEAGAVTVDWVVLTAAIVGLGIVVMTSVGGGITGLADKTNTTLGGYSAGYGTNATP